MIATPANYLAMADEDLVVARKLLGDGHIRTAVSRSYYAMFYTATALLYSKNLAYNKHSAVVSGFGEHFAATGVMDKRHHAALREAFNLRQTADYEVDARLTVDQAKQLLDNARAFAQAAREYLNAAD